ncbi:hypothetical protein BJ138DRAFT_1102562 [Hygrophoropsis aurantiaca]|uniref:Uncharacterized protein n=1 Tax=Hygrophoropsis aurantiaca TaxID=72124 RepID=A0ACB8AA65_9AGAM|nr:hypothetical protein BJ138DRAFT_1102562 [Hygrophoropsis aurantiaca]
MDHIKALVIGGSRNIGYYAAVRLLDQGATVTFLLRSPKVFDSDEKIQKHIQSKKARIVKGDALNKADVQRVWDEAALGGPTNKVDCLLFTLGFSGTPGFSLTQGFLIYPPNLVTQALLNVLETLPSPTPKIITISSTGLTRASHSALPLLMRPLYGFFLAAPHKDKRGAEEIVSHCADWEWNQRDCPGPAIMGDNWTARVPARGHVKSILVVRPALLTDGECRGDAKGLDGYRVKEWDMKSAWTISRKDVGHFLVEGALKNWEKWENKCVSIAY